MITFDHPQWLVRTEGGSRYLVRAQERGSAIQAVARAGILDVVNVTEVFPAWTVPRLVPVTKGKGQHHGTRWCLELHTVSRIWTAKTKGWKDEPSGRYNLVHVNDKNEAVWQEPVEGIERIRDGEIVDRLFDYDYPTPRRSRG